MSGEPLFNSYRDINCLRWSITDELWRLCRNVCETDNLLNWSVIDHLRILIISYWSFNGSPLIFYLIDIEKRFVFSFSTLIVNNFDAKDLVRFFYSPPFNINSSSQWNCLITNIWQKYCNLNGNIMNTIYHSKWLIQILLQMSVSKYYKFTHIPSLPTF